MSAGAEFGVGPSNHSADAHQVEHGGEPVSGDSRAPWGFAEKRFFVRQDGCIHRNRKR